MLDILLRLRNIIEIVDVIAVAVVLYWIMLMFKGTKAERMLWGIAVIVIVYFITDRFEFLTLHWILSNFLGSIVIFIIVVFQQDIRRALVKMGRPFSSGEIRAESESIVEIVLSVTRMKEARTGGIIVMERGEDLSEHLDTGVEMDSKVSKELLLSIFNTASPLHDGAVVVRRGRVYKAGCILPLTDKDVSENLSGRGTRHRAAMGLAEETDALVIVVSEETGEAALIVEEEIFTGISNEGLLGELRRRFSKHENSSRRFFPWKAAE
ncbi:MAG: TIGR00159 family protein [Deltaproteobacteria bacterium]|nr:TIGR00159 family protein [Deltaproteobacteria bacterium]